jgi:dATP/dGTP diphosphohydrolase
MEYDATEQDVLIEVFVKMLREVTKDGGRKRAAGAKPPWWKDESHLAAIFSHLNRHFHGEKVDKDSGVSPWVHLAWRALAIGYQETYGQVDPQL